MTQTSRRAASAAARARIDAASQAFSSGAIAEAEWQCRVAAALGAAYLSEDDRRWQSGFSGDSQLWRQAREFILDAVVDPGSFLDVGCASGHLLESLQEWARARQLDLTFYGLEINEDLAEAARRAIPSGADRIFTGNVSEWTPPHRFNYVRIGLEYVPEGREDALVRRVMQRLVDVAGTLIVGPMTEEERDLAAAVLRTTGYSPATAHRAVDRNGKARYVVSVPKLVP